MKGQTISLSYSSETRRLRNSISILVVDDDTTCLSIVAALLKKFKYEVVTVKHPNDALCTLRIKGGAFDLVISDIHMPDMDGFELQEVITHEFNLPVVLMSSDNKEGVASKGLESGAAFFISKPVCPDDLRNLWQFAAMKKKSHVVIEEAGKEINKQNNSDEINISESNVKDSKRKSPSKEEGSDERRGDNSAQSASKKKQKVIWTNALHNRFLEAIRSIGLDRSVPKKILEVMNVPGLTRENVASHLQKYRIFLRRVSDASYKIHADDKGLSRNYASSRLGKPQFHNFAGANRPLFPNQETSPTSPVAQSGLGQHHLPSINGSFLKPNFRHPNLIHQIDDRPHLRPAQTNYQPTPLFQGHAASLYASILSPTTSSLASTNLADQMNYVGYKISNIKRLAESGGFNSCSGTINLHHSGFQNTTTTVNDPLLPSDNVMNLDQSAWFLGPDSSSNVPDNNTDARQLPDVISDYQKLLPPVDLSPLGNLENDGLVHESAFTPMYDLSEFDVTAATQQALGEGDLDCYFPDLANIQNQAQQNGGDQTAVSSSFYDGTNNWDNHFSSYDIQASNQHDDDDYLESLLAFGSFGEDGQIHTLEGI